MPWRANQWNPYVEMQYQRPFSLETIKDIERCNTGAWNKMVDSGVYVHAMERQGWSVVKFLLLCVLAHVTTHGVHKSSRGELCRGVNKHLLILEDWQGSLRPKAYGWPPSSSCGALRPLAKPLYSWAFFVKFLCLLVTLRTNKNLN